MIVEKPRLCIDIDNVLGDTDAIMREIIRDRTQGEVNLQYEDIKEFDYHRCTDEEGNAITEEDWHSVHYEFSRPRNVLRVVPYPRIQEHLRVLSTCYELHLATSRLPCARRATIKWLEVNYFPPHDLHFLKHGEKHISLGGFAAAIEDHREQAEDFATTGATGVLLAHPWNEVADDSQAIRLENWASIVEHLMR